MKKTGTLKVTVTADLARGSFIIHPNVGFEIGMMTTQYTVRWCSEGSIHDFLKGDKHGAFPALVRLLNECPQQTLQMNPIHWKQLGAPTKAVVLYDGDRFFIQPLNSNPTES